MASTVIQLNRVWQLGTQITQGGFGSIFEVLADDQTTAVAKLIPKVPEAARELLFGHLPTHPNIIPVIDSGEWQGYYVLVMPRAEKSLRQLLDESNGNLTLEEKVNILIDVAEALVSLEQGVVHRDIKPNNVLLYNTKWCIADFGIARYADATTSPNTHKFSFTPPYAAPEQWRHEHATFATDVYAFGIMAFEIFQNRRPFLGPSQQDFQQQHLTLPPPALVNCPPPLASLVTECLYKAPQTRPSPSNILVRLRSSQARPSAAVARMQAVNQMLVDKQSRENSLVSAQRSTEERRSDIYQASIISFERIRDGLRDRIVESAPSASILPAKGLVIKLGEASLTIDLLRQAPQNSLSAYGRLPTFDVVGYTSIKVSKPIDRFGYEGRSHSLWFCDAHEEGIYRWFETAFMISPLIRERSSFAPFAMSPTDTEAGVAFSPTMSVRQVAWLPLPFDQGDEEQYFERWIGWLADSASGSLSIPYSMPENSGGFYRNATLKDL